MASEARAPSARAVRRSSSPKRRPGWPLVLTALALLTALTAAATWLRADGTFAAWEQAAVETSDAGQLRLGYFGNLTHGPALVGLQEDHFAQELGGTELSTQVFTSGPTAVASSMGSPVTRSPTAEDSPATRARSNSSEAGPVEGA